MWNKYIINEHKSNWLEQKSANKIKGDPHNLLLRRTSQRRKERNDILLRKITIFVCEWQKPDLQYKVI